MAGYDYVGSLTQAGRLLTIDTPLGQDVLLLERMQGQETLCDLFDFRLHVRSKRQDITPDEMVGLPLSWTLELPGGTRRSWSGVVGAIEAGHAVGDGMRAYTVTAKPWLWLFGHTSDCRIFQHRTTQQILETIFGEAGIRDYDFGAVTGPKEPRGYCVQYNETDLNFVFRLLEEEGWCWWFRHEAGQDGGAGRHVLVVADSPRAFAPGEEPRLRYTTTNVDLNDVTVWTRRWAFKPGAVAESDWNFETPRQDLTRAQPTVNPIKTSKPFEMYRWGGRFLEKGRADHITRRRMEVHEAAFDTVTAESGNRRVTPGQGFTLYGNPIAAENGDYTVVSVDHEAKDPTYAPDAGTEGPSYANRFVAMPANKPFVPEQKTPHPKIEGVQTATVVGPPGEEIWIDQYGRIQVAFHWDRYAKQRDGDSCWIQVCHAVSGGNHGLQVKPRIGMTAFITYVDGDPDKPLCIGTAPNPDNMVSYAFPDNKTRSTWRSLSHKAQGYVGNNEISMEDDTGRENLFLHAQKDHTLKVRNNHVKRVDNDKVESIGASKAINVASNHKEEIGGSMNLTVGGAGGGAPGLLANVAGLAGSSAGLIAQATSIAQRGGAFSGGGGATSAGAPWRRHRRQPGRRRPGRDPGADAELRRADRRLGARLPRRPRPQRALRAGGRPQHAPGRRRRAAGLGHRPRLLGQPAVLPARDDEHRGRQLQIRHRRRRPPRTGRRRQDRQCRTGLCRPGGHGDAHQGRGDRRPRLGRKDRPPQQAAFHGGEGEDPAVRAGRVDRDQRERHRHQGAEGGDQGQFDRLLLRRPGQGNGLGLQ